jgi:hypothetical protein
MNEDEVMCQICHKIHKRVNTKDWAYYKGDLYCINHPGVREWLQGALKIETFKMDYERKNRE